MDNCPHCGGALALRIGQTIYFDGREPRIIAVDPNKSEILLIDPSNWHVAAHFNTLRHLGANTTQFSSSQPYSLEPLTPVYGKSPTEAVADRNVPLTWQAPKR